MARFDVVLTDGRNDWLETVEAGSNRDAISKVTNDLLRRRFTNVTIKNSIKLPEKRGKTPVVPEHIAPYVGQS